MLEKMWWCLTNDGLQRLTQSRGETSLSLTDDGLDDGGSLLNGLSLGQQKLMSLVYELSKSRCRCED